MLFRRRARLTAKATLIQAATLAGNNVKSQATPLELGDAPAINVRTMTAEIGEGSQSGQIKFHTTCELFIEVIVAATSFEDCSDDLDTLSEQVTDALLTNPAWYIPLSPESYPKLDRNTQINAESDRHIGRDHIIIGLTYSDEYAPALPFPFKTATLKVDTGSPFDTAGPYPAIPGFPPPAPPPRVSGPDGRLELEQTITFPQDEES